jgi:hypothetical protein
MTWIWIEVSKRRIMFLQRYNDKGHCIVLHNNSAVSMWTDNNVSANEELELLQT